MKKLLKSTTICLLLLSACDGLWEYRGLNELAKMTWSKGDVQTFDATISETGEYDVYILFRHVHGFPYKDINVNLNMTGPSTLYDQSYTIPIIGDDKEYLGEGSVDIWDVELLAMENETLAEGAYTINLQHEMVTEDLQLVMEVGVRIQKPKSEE
ncbi:MAG TPA: hypothetical protein DCX14_10055 [Flavobacteriales bacterium]|jgi:gliding motility-associated lipoprotein GldH|nr:hypothetical protein [Flavobacteriales bacterium]HAW20515.1 hypothetical protein [Flavobacteriales bacterium]